MLKISGKGLVSKVVPRHLMPRDENGFIADLIMDPPSVPKRTAMGQFFEQTINRMSEFVRRQCEQRLNDEGVESAWTHLTNWYKEIHPSYGELCDEIFPSKAERKKHLDDVISDFIYLNVPAFLKTMDEINIDIWAERWNVEVTPVTYFSENIHGEMVERRTPGPEAIGTKYILRLHKDGEFSSPGVSTVSHHGLPVPPPKSTTMSSLFKRKPGRKGEDEGRNLMSDVDPKEVMRNDRLTSRSPRCVEEVITELFHNPNPTAIGRYPISDERLALNDIPAHQLHHLMAIAGVDTFDTLHSKEDPTLLAPDDYIGQ